MISAASIKIHGGLPCIESAINVASIIDHGVGDYEVVFEKPISESYFLDFQAFDQHVILRDPHADKSGGKARIPSIRVITENGRGTQVDCNFDIKIHEVADV